MDPLVSAFIAIGLLLILVLIVYLVDRVNTIERETRKMAQLAQSMTQPPETPKDPFAGLSGKRLWDAMTGKPPPHITAEVMAEVRERYELVLLKHLDAIYKEGWRDGERGFSADPPNTRSVSTATATVESWLPGAQVKTLYQCGLEASQRPPELWDALRAEMDEAARIIYEKTQIELRQPLSGWLMSLPPVATDALAAATDTPAPPTTAKG